jgi:hypothetical protein
MIKWNLPLTGYAYIETIRLCERLIKEGANYSFIKEAENSICFILQKELRKPEMIFAAGEYIMLNFGDIRYNLSYTYRYPQKDRVIQIKERK